MKQLFIFALIVAAQASSAINPIFQEDPDNGQRVIGNVGRFYCTANCISTCGSGLEADTVASQMTFTARDISDKAALNRAVAYCISFGNSGSCPVKGSLSTATTPQLLSDYTIGFRNGVTTDSDGKQTYIKSANQVLLNSTPANLDCVIKH